MLTSSGAHRGLVICLGYLVVSLGGGDDSTTPKNTLIAHVKEITAVTDLESGVTLTPTPTRSGRKTAIEEQIIAEQPLKIKKA